MHRLLIIKEEFEKNVCLQKMKMEAKARIGSCGVSGPETPPPGVDMGAVCSGGWGAGGEVGVEAAEGLLLSPFSGIGGLPLGVHPPWSCLAQFSLS